MNFKQNRAGYVKHILGFILTIVLLISNVLAEGKGELSKMPINELTSLYANVLAEIKARTFTAASSVPTNIGSDEILFRKIPWYSSPEEYSKLVDISSLRGPSETSCHSWEWKGNDIGTSLHSLSDSGVYVYTFPDNFTVGGIPIKSVYAYFLYDTENDLPVRDESKAKFYKAEYSFEAIDMATAYEILKGKMEGLYGSAKKLENVTNVWNLSGNDYEQHDEWYAWYGANDTGVYLKTQYQIDSVDHTTKYTTLKLVYGKTNSASLLSELEASFAKEEIENMVNNDNNEGL